jgi:hypothetical protein
MLEFPYLMSDCWLEVSLHPEGPATGQLNQGFSVVFFGPRSNIELVPKFHVALHASHAVVLTVTLKVSLERSPSNAIKIIFWTDSDHMLYLYQKD